MKNGVTGSKESKFPEKSWEAVLPDALLSIRSLFCTATNCTPHERLFTYNRKSTNGCTLPVWLTQSGPVLLRRFVRDKNDPLVDKVELLDVNDSYAYVCFPNGREDTVSVRGLAPIATRRDSEPEKDVLTSTMEKCRCYANWKSKTTYKYVRITTNINS